MPHIISSRLPSDDVQHPNRTETPNTTGLNPFPWRTVSDCSLWKGHLVPTLQPAWRKSRRERPWVSQLELTRWVGKAGLGRAVTMNPSCPSSLGTCVPICPGLHSKTVRAVVRAFKCHCKAICLIILIICRMQCCPKKSSQGCPTGARPKRGDSQCGGAAVPGRT